VAAFLMVALAWLGASVLTQPWNPYLPLVSFLVVLLGTWSVLDGDHRMLVPQTVAGTLCAQTHVPYLLLSVVLIGVSLATVVWRWWRARMVDRPSLVSVGVSVGVGFLLWLPVFVDQLRHDPGNITMLRRHFLNPPEPPQGLRVGITTTLQHFDILHIGARMVGRSSSAIATYRDLVGGSTAVGAVVVAAWAVSAGVAWRLVRDRRLARLHVVVGISVALSMLSISRVFGKVWYYLSLWAWGIALLAVLATVWTVVAWWESQPGRRRVPIAVPAAIILGVAGLLFVRDAARVRPPEDRLGRSLAAVVPPTAAALRAGVGAADGPEGSYVVVWSDAYYFGSQGYGLVSELERLGLHAYGTPTYHVPMTAQRVMEPASATAEVVLATGVNVARWAAVDGVEQVADVDPRTPAEHELFDRLHGEVVDELGAAALDDLVPMVDTNLFGLSIDQRLPAATEAKIATMLVLGEETAVFIAPAGTFDARP
jgi:hypothetical protein